MECPLRVACFLSGREVDPERGAYNEPFAPCLETGTVELAWLPEYTKFMSIEK